ncbi:MAG: hypothetical protein L6R40_008695 [Gallowayella cf. fulva]|nr:MAG: hypothetical protein L6R40_008695 [Xanthomendoza cf. fulva]
MIALIGFSNRLSFLRLLVTLRGAAGFTLGYRKSRSSGLDFERLLKLLRAPITDVRTTDVLESVLRSLRKIWLNHIKASWLLQNGIKMPASFWLLLISLHTSVFCLAATVIPQANPIANLSVLPDIPDHRFSVRVSHQVPKLRFIDCQMAIIAAMRELTLMDFDTELRAEAYRHARFPGIFVLVSPGYGLASTSVRFAIWTLHAAMRSILTENKCQRTFYYGDWDKREMAKAMILPDLAATTGTQTDIMVPPIQEVSTTTASDNLDPNGNISFNFRPHLHGTDIVGSDELRADITYLGKTMDPRDIIVTVTVMMLRLAPTNRDDLEILSVSDGIKREVKSVFNRAARSLPYIMTSGDLISLLAFLPEQCLRDSKWEEMDVTVTDNDHPRVVMARGSFRIGKGKLPGGMKNGTVEIS